MALNLSLLGPFSPQPGRQRIATGGVMQEPGQKKAEPIFFLVSVIDVIEKAATIRSTG
jgi:hypothetical protein